MNREILINAPRMIPRHATMELENGILCQFNSSWTVRVRRDDLFVMQVDGSKGSAVVGLRECRTQSIGETP